MTIKPFSTQCKKVDNNYKTIQQYILSFVDLQYKQAEVLIDKEVLIKQYMRTQCEFVKGDNEPDIVKLQGYSIL